MYPVQRGPAPAPLFKARKYPLDTMEVGDWFFVPHRTKNTLVSHISTVATRLDRKFTTRLCWMTQDAGVWRVLHPFEPGGIQGIYVRRIK